VGQGSGVPPLSMRLRGRVFFREGCRERQGGLVGWGDPKKGTSTSGTLEAGAIAMDPSGNAWGVL